MPCHNLCHRQLMEAFLRLTMRLIVFHEFSSNIPGHTVNVRHFVPEPDTVEFVGMLEQFWPESGRDELCIFAELVNHVGNGMSMLSVKGLKF